MTTRRISERLNSPELRVGFKLQSHAIDYPRPNHPLPIFAYDANIENKKQYIVASYASFYAHYASVDPKHRHHYELIRADFECNLYLDVEVDLALNPSIAVDEGHAFSSELERELVAFVVQKCAVSDADIDVVALDSSTPQRKLSRHYVVRIRDACFVNNFHCGALMRSFGRHLVERHGTPAQNKFFVQTDRESSEPRICALDLTVYTKNRLFRIYGSHKIGSDERTRSFWLPAEKAQRCAPENIDARRALPDSRTFMMMLIQYFDAEPKRRIECREWDGSEATSTSDIWAHIHDLLPADTHKLRKTSSSSAAAPRPQQSGSAVLDRTWADDVVRYVCEQFSGRGGAKPCQSRTHAFDVPSGCMTIPLMSQDCRMLRASNPQERHETNEIYVIVWFASGEWYQKCHSTRACCANARSRCEKLPKILAERCLAFVSQSNAAETLDARWCVGWALNSKNSAS